jgi:RNA polymerase sigma-70 factor (ECF subfamily)
MHACTIRTPLSERKRARFEREMRSTYHRVYAYAFRILRSRDAAADVAQETYLRAWRHYERFDPERRFDRWVLRIAGNLALDQLRRRRRAPLALDVAIPEPGGGETLHREPVDERPGPESSAMRCVIDPRITSALQALPASYREALWLSAVEEKPYDEIAAALKCPVGTIRSRVHRARERVRKLLETPGGPCRAGQS